MRDGWTSTELDLDLDPGSEGIKQNQFTSMLLRRR